MKMRWLICALVLALMVPLPGRTQDADKPAAKPAAPGGPQPRIEIPTMSFAFGDMYHQDQYVHTFVVRNRGNADLVIEDVTPG
jgi:hypothetical protein